MSALPRLHAVTNDDVLQRPDFVERALVLYRQFGPGVAVQLRGRQTSARSLHENALPLRAAGILIVNDRVDLARITQAHGAHLRGDSLSTAAARALLTPETWIGRSVHSVAEAEAAEQAGANYLILGTIFESRSHPGAAPLGLSILRQVIGKVSIPVIAIGGVTVERAAQCREAGSYGVAAVSALWNSEWSEPREYDEWQRAAARA